MRRPNPGLDPAGALAAWRDSADRQKDGWSDYACKLVTPMYGGGVQAGVVDEAMPIRAAGLRGQLRFWWRIACGPVDSPADMFRRESAIWGGIGASGPTASKVSVRVDSARGLSVEPAFDYGQPVSGRYRTSPREATWIEPYAVFPARGELSKDKHDIAMPPHELARAGLAFRLRIRLHEDLAEPQRKEVETALRWWASFGGVGARTRRGLGAVHARSLEPVSAEEVEARGGRLGCRASTMDTEQAWKVAVGRLRDFRQKPGVGRNPSSKDRIPAGRSRWPEPDMLRRQTGRHALEHEPEHPVQEAYPRAAFGLPIVFHFKDEREGDPPQQMLVPQEQDRDRMASPLILRPYWDGQGWRPAALLLPGWEEALAVVAGTGDGAWHRAWPADADDQARLAAGIRPMAGRGSDPLSAFMAYFLED